MKKILTIVLVLLLFGCQSRNQVLNPPSNIIFNHDEMVISWDKINDAISYVLDINSEQHPTNNTFFDMSDFPVGNYTIRVKAIYEKGHSYYSNAIHVKIIKSIDIDFTFNDFILEWSSPIQDLTYAYKLYDFEDSFISSHSLLDNTLTIDQQGRFYYVFSAFFDENKVFEKVLYFDVTGYVYAKTSEYLTINTIAQGIVFINEQPLKTSDHSFNGNILTIHNSYFRDLQDGNYTIKIVNDDIFFTFINVTSILSPTLISPSEVNYNGEDLTFNFEMHEGSFVGLSSTPNISTNMYLFNNGVLTIKKEFINQIILDQPTRKIVVFSYILENGPFTIIGSLVVRLGSN